MSIENGQNALRFPAFVILLFADYKELTVSRKTGDVRADVARWEDFTCNTS